MAKKTTVHHSSTSQSTILAWLALAVSLLALVTALSNPMTRETIRESKTTQKIEETSENQLEAIQARLEDLEPLIKAKKFDEAQKELTEIRADLKVASMELSSEAQGQWQELDDELAVLGEKLQNKTADAISSLQRSLGDLRQLILSL